jgi:ectoine hydroxylase-related dioxygenase (phytanoyl-CoA dioxygenase family)
MRLSLALLAIPRTLRPSLPAQNLHVDFERDGRGWTMVGFIFMVDEFRNDNGATRFVPGSGGP